MSFTDLECSVIHPAFLVQGQHDEAAAAADLDDDGQELGVDGAKVAVVRIARDLDVLVAPLLLEGRAVDVLELGRPDPPKVHPPLRLLTARSVQHVQHHKSSSQKKDEKDVFVTQANFTR